MRAGRKGSDYGKLVKKRLIDLGMTQAELAKRAGIPRTNITRFESGNYNPSLEMLVRIAAALGMTLQVQLITKE